MSSLDQVHSDVQDAQEEPVSIPTSSWLAPTSQDDLRLNQLKVLANATRLQILLLLQNEEHTLAVRELVEKIGGLAQPTVSYHLRKLRQVGLVDCQKHGLHAYYYLHRDRLLQVSRLLSELSSPQA